jgi:hypothetical protein
MKKKYYEKPSLEVVVLNQQQALLVNGSIDASMEGTFTETDLAREAVFTDDGDLFVDDEQSVINP